MCSKAQHKDRKLARGQSLIEFVLALPALLILFLALIEMALAMRAKLVLTNANREAARYASQGTFTDEQVVERAVVSFAEQLPVSMSGPDANTGIIVSRFHVPVGADEEAEKTRYVSGTLNYTTGGGEPMTTTSKLPDDYIEKLVAQNKDFYTDHDVAVIETYYHHYQVLRAPLIEWVYPEPIVLYVRTAMRIASPRTQE